MDKVSFIAYELYHSTNDANNRKMALELLRGETTIKEISKDKVLKGSVNAAQEKYKRFDFFSHSNEYAEIVSFIEEHFYTASM